VSKPTRKKKPSFLVESAPFVRKLGGSLKSKPGRLLNLLLTKTEK
jgi:hypothetical protein